MKQTNRLKIEYVPKESLKPYLNNAKIHTAEQIEQIKKSIEEFSFNDPIGIYGDNEVVEGHGRLLAVMEMDDVKEVPVIRLDHMTDEERRAYALVHNQLTMNSGFDFDLLQEELKSLTLDMDDFGFDIEKEFQSDAFRPTPQNTGTASPVYDPFVPEPYNDEDIQEYTDNQENYIPRRRVIITYLPQDEQKVKEMLGVAENIKVLYEFEELIG